MITSDQLKDVLTRVDALHKYLEIDKKKIEFEEEQLRTQAPDLRTCATRPMNCNLPSISTTTTW